MTRTKPNEEVTRAILLLLVTFFVSTLSIAQNNYFVDFETGQQSVTNNCSSTGFTYFSNSNPISGSMSMRSFFMASNNAGPHFDTPEFYDNGQIYVTTKATSLNHDPYMWVYAVSPGTGNHTPVGHVQYKDTLVRIDTFDVISGEFIRFYWATNTGPVGVYDQIIIDDINTQASNACFPLPILEDHDDRQDTYLGLPDECVYVYYTFDGKCVGEKEDFINQPPGYYVRKCTATGLKNIVVKIE